MYRHVLEIQTGLMPSLKFQPTFCNNSTLKNLLLGLVCIGVGGKCLHNQWCKKGPFCGSNKSYICLSNENKNTWKFAVLIYHRTQYNKGFLVCVTV